jgi:hypothetical protein
MDSFHERKSNMLRSTSDDYILNARLQTEDVMKLETSEMQSACAQSYQKTGFMLALNVH